MPILCIGISVVGLVDYRQQEIRFAANLHFLNGKQLGKDVGRLVGLECVLVHDAHSLCLAEYVYGEATNLDSFAVLDMSTGIGLGVMVNHQFLTGHSGFAGEMGHIPIVPNGRKCHCGRRGCLETVASEWVFLERISERLERPVEFEEVMALASKGDRLVRAELNRLCKYLAIAIAHVVNLFDPQCVFVTGRMFDELPWMRDHLVSRAKQIALEPAFANCSFMSSCGSHLLGAVATAISRHFFACARAQRYAERHHVRGHPQVGCLMWSYRERIAMISFLAAAIAVLLLQRRHARCARSRGCTRVFH